MKSRITIEVDFDNGNEPVIQIISRNSDDVRDNLIKSFYQKLQGSSWCKIVFKQDVLDEQMVTVGGYVEGFKRIYITPIPESELKTEAAIMLEQHRVRESYDRYSVHANLKEYEVDGVKDKYGCTQVSYTSGEPSLYLRDKTTGEGFWYNPITKKVVNS